MSYQIICTSCNHIEKDSVITCSICNSSLESKNTNSYAIDTQAKSVFLRYHSFFSEDNPKILKKYPNSPTPIIKLSEKNVFAKLEYCSFSFSSKDREAFIEISIAIKLGYKGIAVASTGNMGGALASLCATYQFPCFVFVPNDTSETKIKQITQFGAIIKKVAGTYDDIVPLVKKFAQENNLFLASLQAFRFEGYKTIAYEIYETFGKLLPKNITIPLGDGTTYVAVWKGFQDLLSLHFIDKCPSLIGVQASQCAPIANAFSHNSAIQVISNPKTIAKAIRIGSPLDGEYAIKVAHQTKGKILSYTENQIVEAQISLLKQGINAEYTSALTYCPILFDKMESCLLLITGSGFKN